MYSGPAGARQEAMEKMPSMNGTRLWPFIAGQAQKCRPDVFGAWRGSNTQDVLRQTIRRFGGVRSCVIDRRAPEPDSLAKAAQGLTRSVVKEKEDSSHE